MTLYLFQETIVLLNHQRPPLQNLVMIVLLMMDFVVSGMKLNYQENPFGMLQVEKTLRQAGPMGQ